MFILLETRLIGGLPDLSERDGAMEPVEDTQRQSDPLYEDPGEESIKVKLHRISVDLLSLKSIDYPHGHVADQQERNNLSTRLAAIMFRQMNPPARHIGDKEHLKYHLADRQ